jgi:hypothetical protein
MIHRELRSMTSEIRLKHPEFLPGLARATESGRGISCSSAMSSLVS